MRFEAMSVCAVSAMHSSAVTVYDVRVGLVAHICLPAV